LRTLNEASDLPATIALTDDGEALWGLGGLWIIKISAAQTGGSFALIEVTMKKGTGTPLHRHDLDDETFIVIDGTLALLSDGVRVDAGPGEAVHLPGGREHAWRAESDVARFFVLSTPRHEDFYRSCCVPAERRELPPNAGEIDLSIIIPNGKKHGVQIVSPPPVY
jgi:quercetin dioxygenase-like cupin family protein